MKSKCKAGVRILWSLLVPSIEQAAHMGRLAVLPAFIGFWIGMLFLLLLDEIIPHLHMNSEEPHSNIGTIAFTLGFTGMMALDVMLG